jgi:hypothetical protein
MQQRCVQTEQTHFPLPISRRLWKSEKHSGSSVTSVADMAQQINGAAGGT